MVNVRIGNHIDVEAGGDGKDYEIIDMGSTTKCARNAYSRSQEIQR